MQRTLEAPLPARVVHGFGAASLGFSLVNSAMLLFLARFLVDEAGIEPALAGGIVLVAKLWDAVSDPLVGRLTDRTRTSMGARRPWMLGAIFPLAVVFAVLWQPLPVIGWARVAAYGTLLVLYSTALTCVVVPYGALTPSLARTYDDGTRLNASRMGWGLLGGVCAAVLMPALRGWTGTYGAGALVLAIVAVPPVLWTVYATRGLDRPGPQPATLGLEVLRVRAFQGVVLLFLAAWGSLSVLAALLPFYLAHHTLRADLEPVFLGAVQLAAIAAIPAVAWVAQRLDKHRAYVLFMGSWVLLLPAMALLPRGGAWSWTLVALVLAGPGMAAAHVLPWAMIPDVVAADRQATGVDRSGAFYGVMTFIEKVGTAVGLQAVLLGLSLVGYVAGAEEQSDGAIRGLVAMMALGPAFVLAAATALAWSRAPRLR